MARYCFNHSLYPQGTDTADRLLDSITSNDYELGSSTPQFVCDLFYWLPFPLFFIFITVMENVLYSYNRIKSLRLSGNEGFNQCSLLGPT